VVKSVNEDEGIVIVPEAPSAEMSTRILIDHGPRRALPDRAADRSRRRHHRISGPAALARGLDLGGA
jgi:hypothetical protein